jgi:REP element-mobilizing transposase RayT
MPRKPRLFISEATYHVYSRVARGEFAFDDPYEAEEFVETVRRVRDVHNWRVLAWCLMGNHYHLVVKTGTVPLWRSMQRLQSIVAREFNRRRGYLGRLWQSRYRARIIDSNDYFRQVVSYVHLNPVAAGVVYDPVDYPNSGHREIVGHRPPRLIDISSVLAGFSEGPGSTAQERYLAWVRAVAEARWFAQGLEELPWWKGARDTTEIVDGKTHPEAKTFDGKSLEYERPSVSAANFANMFERFSGHSIADLSSPLRTSDLTRGRVELTTLAVTRFEIRSTDLADLIGKHRSSITRWLNIGLHQQRNDRAFRLRIEFLERKISSTARDNASMRHVAPWWNLTS